MAWLYIVGFFVVLIGLSAFFGAPYVPSHRKDVRRMFDKLVPIGKGDVVLDIGSGDGLVLREASHRGARAVGYEIHPLFVGISKLLSLGDKRVRIRWVNAWTAPFPEDVTLVHLFAVGRDGKRVVKKLQAEAQKLGGPLKVVCYGNPLPMQTPVQAFEAYYLYQFVPLH